MASRDLTTDLYALIDPAGPGMGALVKRCRETLGPDDGDVLDAGLRRVAGHLAQRPVRVTFGGHFKSGKSSLINMMIGRPLLPSSGLPETGVPCVLESGQADQAIARTGRGDNKIPCTTEAIGQYVSLIGADGGYRDSIRAVKEVRITLANRPIPAGTTWVDSPGINDTGEMTELAERLARETDVLVWVTKSGATMAQTEQAFVSRHLQEAGPASVVFILNVVLSSDTVAEWEKFTATRLDRNVSLITKNVDTDGVPARVACTSARAAAAAPGGFGEGEARAMLATLSHPGAHRVAATRIFRAAAELRAVMEQLDARIADEEQRTAAATAKATAALQARSREDDEFRRAVRKELSTLLGSYSGAIEHCAAQVTRKLMKGSTPREARYYESRFASKLRAATKRAAPRAKCARAHRRGTLDDSGREAIVRILKLRAAPIPGYAKRGGDIFEKLGEWWNSAKNERNAIESQLRRAASAASAELLDATERIADQAARHCAPGAPAIPAVDQSRLHALRAARRTLEDNVAEPLRRALSAAQTQAGA